MYLKYERIFKDAENDLNVFVILIDQDYDCSKCPSSINIGHTHQQ